MNWTAFRVHFSCTGFEVGQKIKSGWEKKPAENCVNALKSHKLRTENGAHRFFFGVRSERPRRQRFHFHVYLLTSSACLSFDCRGETKKKTRWHSIHLTFDKGYTLYRCICPKICNEKSSAQCVNLSCHSVCIVSATQSTRNWIM